jgi:hypothetical protein
MNGASSREHAALTTARKLRVDYSVRHIVRKLSTILLG